MCVCRVQIVALCAEGIPPPVCVCVYVCVCVCLCVCAECRSWRCVLKAFHPRCVYVYVYVYVCVIVYVYSADHGAVC